VKLANDLMSIAWLSTAFLHSVRTGKIQVAPF